MTLSHSAQSGQHPHSERGADLYSTPPCAVEALLRVETLPLWCWEPAAGRGAIVRVLRDCGHGFEKTGCFIKDFEHPVIKTLRGL